MYDSPLALYLAVLLACDHRHGLAASLFRSMPWKRHSTCYPLDTVLLKNDGKSLYIQGYINEERSVFSVLLAHETNSTREH